MADHTTHDRSLNKTVALVFGATYALVGIAGFFITGDLPFFGEEGDPLVIFDVNGAHNIVHLLIGLALLAASRRHDTARSMNLAIGVTYIALGVLGPFVDDTAVDIVGLNSADHGLHLVSGALLAGVALLADKHARNRTNV
jgi:hypothetical protein